MPGHAADSANAIGDVFFYSEKWVLETACPALMRNTISLILHDMDSDIDFEIVDGVTFDLRPNHRYPTEAGRVCLRKNREFTNRYLSLSEEFRNCRMVEAGVDQGGSTSFFTKLLQPEKLLSFDIAAQPVKRVQKFLAKHDPEGRVELHWGVDQSDSIAVPALLDSTFGSKHLDLVVDDASHLFAPSTSTFEMLFPRLRPGGLYILEDWSCQHLQERHMALAIENEVDGKLSQKIQGTIDEGFVHAVPMSVLICQLVVAAGRNPDWISEIRLTDGFCEVRRGVAEIPTDSQLADYVGVLGQWVFEGRA